MTARIADSSPVFTFSSRLSSSSNFCHTYHNLVKLRTAQYQQVTLISQATGREYQLFLLAIKYKIM
jgi:hypothetical protein